MLRLIAGLAAQELGISTRTLSLWAKKGLIKSERTPGGWRLYDVRDVLRLKRRLVVRK